MKHLARELRRLWPHFVVLGVLGLALTMGYRAFGWAGVLALSAPAAMMYVAMKQYISRTTVYVRELRQMTERLNESHEATLQALTRALDTRDEETEEHSLRVRHYSELRMVAHIPFLAQAAEIILHHHEAYDGSGYPSGLSGEQIPLGARLFAVADTFDAITSDRSYRKRRSYAEAITEIKRRRGTQFDPRVVDLFVTIPLEELGLPSAAGSAAQRFILHADPRPHKAPSPPTRSLQVPATNTSDD